MRRLSPARRERTALAPEAAGFPGDRRLRGKVECLGSEVRPVTVPQIAPKEERRVLGYASDD